MPWRKKRVARIQHLDPIVQTSPDAKEPGIVSHYRSNSTQLKQTKNLAHLPNGKRHFHFLEMDFYPPPSEPYQQQVIIYNEKIRSSDLKTIPSFQLEAFQLSMTEDLEPLIEEMQKYGFFRPRKWKTFPMLLTVLIFILGAMIGSAAIIHYIDWYTKILWVLCSALVVVSGFIGYAVSGITRRVVFACINFGRGQRIQIFLNR